MKKIIILLLLWASCLNAQTFYTVYDCTTLKVLFSANQEPKPACSTYAMVTENWINPTYNSACDCFYNNATPQQQADYLAAQQAASVNCEDMAAINDLITTPQSNTQLSALYSCQLPGFRLTCPNLAYPNFAGSQTEYIKQNNGAWGRNFSFKNQ